MFSLHANFEHDTLGAPQVHTYLSRLNNPPQVHTQLPFAPQSSLTPQLTSKFSKIFVLLF